MNRIKINLAIGMGRGVFAVQPIRTKTIVATCHTWVLSEKDIKSLSNTSIAGNYFANPFNGDECLLALGDLSLINHSSNPNTEIQFIKTKTGIVIKAVVNRGIKAGEQLFIDYGPEYTYGN